MEHEQDSLAMEMLKEQKAENIRKGRQNVLLLCLWFLTIVIFVWYLNQYDFSGTTTETYEATGYNALIDSSGNVLATDIPDSILEEIMNYGDSQNDQN